MRPPLTASYHQPSHTKIHTRGPRTIQPNPDTLTLSHERPRNTQTMYVGGRARSRKAPKLQQSRKTMARTHRVVLSEYILRPLLLSTR